MLVDFMMVDFQRLMDPRTLDDEDTGSSTAAFGSAGYMAPEQETRGVVSRRTDVYGLGVLLFEMLTGESFSETGPWTRDSLAKRLRDANQWAPGGLAELILKAAAKDPKERFPSARELGQAVPRPAQGLLSRLLGRFGR